jgi:hypothetical protein
MESERKGNMRENKWGDILMTHEVSFNQPEQRPKLQNE